MRPLEHIHAVVTFSNMRVFCNVEGYRAKAGKLAGKVAPLVSSCRCADFERHVRSMT
jgi:hypothetical protein